MLRVEIILFKPWNKFPVNNLSLSSISSACPNSLIHTVWLILKVKTLCFSLLATFRTWVWGGGVQGETSGERHKRRWGDEEWNKTVNTRGNIFITLHINNLSFWLNRIFLCSLLYRLFVFCWFLFIYFHLSLKSEIDNDDNR